MTAFTARALSTNRLQEVVTKAGHGFVVGDVVSFDGVDWELSLATSIFLSQGTCMVSLVLDVNTFVVTQVGHIVGIVDASIAPLNIGVQYYVSPTLAGAMTITRPSTVGQIINPCFVADTANSGYFFGGTGTEVESSVMFAWTTIVADQTLAVNNGYFTNGAAQLNLLLPPVSVEGDVVEIVALNNNAFLITQAAGQQINTLGGSSTLGVGGSVSATVAQTKVVLICEVANTIWSMEVNGSVLVT